MYQYNQYVYFLNGNVFKISLQPHIKSKFQTSRRLRIKLDIRNQSCTCIKETGSREDNGSSYRPNVPNLSKNSHMINGKRYIILQLWLLCSSICTKKKFEIIEHKELSFNSNGDQLYYIKSYVSSWRTAINNMCVCSLSFSW